MSAEGLNEVNCLRHGPRSFFGRKVARPGRGVRIAAGALDTGPVVGVSDDVPYAAVASRRCVKAERGRTKDAGHCRRLRTAGARTLMRDMLSLPVVELYVGEPL